MCSFLSLSTFKNGFMRSTFLPKCLVILGWHSGRNDDLINFVHSLEFFVQFFLKIGQSLISGLDKKNQKSRKIINFPVSEAGHFFCQKKIK